jgi:hypothetical protein
MPIIAAALGVGNAALAGDAGVACYALALNLVEMVGHAHGLAQASQIVMEKTGNAALAQVLEDAAAVKQAEAGRQLANFRAAGCR